MDKFSKKMTDHWDAQLYDRAHHFVAEYGLEVVKMLAPKPGEKILDLGCGTGYLTQAIAQSGAQVLGIDRDVKMLEQARENYPLLSFEWGNGENLEFGSEFDAVFSNAALHWMKNAQGVVAGVARSLKPGGRFVAEFGGKGNVHKIITAIRSALVNYGYEEKATLNPWYYPSVGEYSTLLEAVGLEVQLGVLFDRPTPLNDGQKGLENWLKMFASNFFQGIEREELSQIIETIKQELSPQIYRDETWFADYRRLRILAIKMS